MSTFAPVVLARSGSFTLTDHACLRMAQRNLSADELAYCCRLGTLFHRRGECHLVLRRRDIPARDLTDNSPARLEGTDIVFAQDGGIKTIYRDRQAPAKVRRRPETGWGFREIR